MVVSETIVVTDAEDTSGELGVAWTDVVRVTIAVPEVTAAVVEGTVAALEMTVVVPEGTVVWTVVGIMLELGAAEA